MKFPCFRWSSYVLWIYFKFNFLKPQSLSPLQLHVPLFSALNWHPKRAVNRQVSIYGQGWCFMKVRKVRVRIQTHFLEVLPAINWMSLTRGNVTVFLLPLSFSPLPRFLIKIVLIVSPLFCSQVSILRRSNNFSSHQSSVVPDFRTRTPGCPALV